MPLQHHPICTYPTYLEIKIKYSSDESQAVGIVLYD